MEQKRKWTTSATSSDLLATGDVSIVFLRNMNDFNGDIAEDKLVLLKLLAFTAADYTATSQSRSGDWDSFEGQAGQEPSVRHLAADN
jgi:hypothetical protein